MQGIIPSNFRRARNALIADLENAKYSVHKFGRYGRGVDNRDVTYMWQGNRILAGSIITTSRGLVLLSYPSERSEEMEAVAELHCNVVREETSFRAAESYLQQLASRSA